MRRFLTVSSLLAMAVAASVGPARPAVASPAPPERSATTTVPGGVLNSRLVKADQVAGIILDESSTRILFLTRSVPPTLRIKDRVTRAVTDVPSPPGQQPNYAWLAPRGIVLTTIAAPGSTARRLYQWTGTGAPIDLGPLDDQYSPVVRGSYVAWYHSFTLYRRNLDTRTTVVVAATAAGLGDVTPTGDVVYFGAAPGGGRFQIFRYHNGHTQTIPDDDPQRSDRIPITDGVNIVYSKGFVFERPHETWLFNGTDNIQLYGPDVDDPNEVGGTFDVAGGWTAFLGWAVDNYRQVWVRDPAGTVSVVSTLAGTAPDTTTRIVAINASGQTLYTNADSIYLAAPGQAQITLASGVGGWSPRHRISVANFASYVDGQWNLAIGGTLYVLSTQPTSTLSLSVGGPGTILVSPYGLTCPTACGIPFAPGATVTLTARADRPGWVFAGWTGDCQSTTTRCTIRIRRATTVHARFLATPPPPTRQPAS